MGPADGQLPDALPIHETLKCRELVIVTGLV